MQCPYFGTCRGCQTQHLPYEVQLENKKKNLSAILCRDFEVFGSEPFGYRNRMEFLFNSNGPALRTGKSLVNVEACPICDDSINRMLGQMKFESYPFNCLVLRSAKETSASFVLDKEDDNSEAIALVEGFASRTDIDNVIITFSEDDAYSEDFFMVKGSDTLHEALLGKDFEFSVQGFFQNNTAIAEKMHAWVRERLQPGKQLLDLYAGVGTFGIINTDKFERVVIAESFRKCIDSANNNIKANNVSNAKAFALDARQIARLDLIPSTIILDPPRSGIDPKALAEIRKLGAKQIFYVSCNPHKLKKDLAKMKEYKMRSAALFDMFPQTNHYEAVVELAL